MILRFVDQELVGVVVADGLGCILLIVEHLHHLVIMNGMKMLEFPLGYDWGHAWLELECETKGEAIMKVEFTEKDTRVALKVFWALAQRNGGKIEISQEEYDAAPPMEEISVRYPMGGIAVGEGLVLKVERK